MSRLLFACAVTAALLLPTIGAAQAPENPGFWAGIGISPGFGRCDLQFASGNPVCSDARKTGISGFVQFGGTLSDHLLVGVEGNGWTMSSADTTREYVMASGIVVVYPTNRQHLFLKGGIGVGRYAEEGTDIVSANGFAFEIGAGYDFALAGRFRLFPFVQYLVVNGNNPERNRVDPVPDELNFNLLMVGVGLKWR